MIEAKLRAAVAADQRLVALRDDPRPAFVWHREAAALVWANRSGAASLGLAGSGLASLVQGADIAIAAAPGKDVCHQFMAIARRLPRSGASRLERIRLPGMAAFDMLACTCRSFEGANGFVGLLIQALAAPARARGAQWAPPSVPETLPPQVEAMPARPAGHAGEWHWVEAEGEKARPAAAIAVPPMRDKPVRFTFRTDAEGRFTFLSPQIDVVPGFVAANWQGRSFADMAESLRLPETEAIVAAFASRTTWTGLSFNWQDRATATSTPIVLNASPVQGRAARFEGFSGFGIAGLPVPLPVQEQAGMHGSPVEAEPAPEPAPASLISWQEAAAEHDEGHAPPPVPHKQPEQPKIVAEKPAEEKPTEDKPSDARVVRLQTKSVPVERKGLTPTERIAFHEIARALGARFEGETPVVEREVELHQVLPQEARPQPALPEPDSTINMPPPAPPQVPERDDEALWLADSVAESSERPTRHGRLDRVPVSLIDRLPVGVIIARGEHLQFANRTMLDLLGYDDISAVREAGGLDHVFAGSEPENGEGTAEGVRLRTASGEIIVVDGRVQTTQWDGESALLISVRRPQQDVAAEKLVYAEQRINELQAVLDTATDGVVILDEAGRIVSVNRSAQALFGYEPREIIGRDLLLLFAPESHRSAYDYLDGLRANGVASLLNDGREVVGRVRQGGSVPLFMTIGRLGEDGRRFCAVLRDVTSFKKAERELVAARRQAEEASSQKSDFLARISHEVRTPLNAIIGFAEVMMEERFGPISNERYRTYINDIHMSGEHVISLVNDLLDLSKIEAGKLDLSFTSVNLNEVVRQAVSLMQPQASRDRIIIRMALATGLPNVVADSRSMRQIVLNLLSNSIKFTPAGGQAIISTTLSEKGEAVLRVRDTGMGMTERELVIAMEPFRQVASTAGEGTGPGTGLGLPLTKALVEANRASFAIQSTKNAGTLVEVTFPSTRVLAE